MHQQAYVHTYHGQVAERIAPAMRRPASHPRAWSGAAAIVSVTLVLLIIFIVRAPSAGRIADDVRPGALPRPALAHELAPHPSAPSTFASPDRSVEAPEPQPGF